jgi:hypothetical protein
MRLVSGNLKYLGYSFLCIAFIATLLSCERREVEEMPKNSDLKQLDLDEYRWKNRLVLIFAPSNEYRFYLEQKSEFEVKSDELEDRDIIVFELLEAGISRIAEIPLNNEQQSLLRKKFEVIDDFVFILIGKDGTVKLRAKEPVSTNDLFSLIDSMPMRKEEMRRKESQSRNKH